MRLTMLCLFSALMCVRGYARQAAEDSLRVYPMKEIIVSSTRSPIEADQSPSNVEVYDAGELRAMPATSVADVLEMSAGAVLNDYGSYGSLKTASLRGSASEHVLVLLNGHRLNSAQNGLTDLSLLPLENVRQIEILHGGSSALYGADALGGVVNILTRAPSDQPQLRGGLGGGSYGFQRYSIEGEGTLAGLGLLAGYSSERGRDDYPYPDAAGPDLLYRQNSDFFLRHFYVEASADPDSRSDFAVHARRMLADRGAPGSIDYPSNGRLADDDVEVGVEYGDRHLEAVEAHLRSDMHYGLETYVDPNPAYPINSYYHNIAYTVNPEISAMPVKELRLLLGLEAGSAVLGSNDFDARVERTQTSFYFTQELHLEREGDVLDQYSLYGALRSDAFSDVEHSWTPKVGANVRLLKWADVHLRSSYGRSFRVPSFNDLYYRYFGNPLLRPEHSTSFDLGATAALPAPVDISLGLTWFVMNTEDRIIFDPTLSLPVNVGKVHANGIELSCEGFAVRERVKWGIEYTSSSTLDRTDPSSPSYDRQLPYQPEEALKAHIDAEFGPARLTLHQALFSERFTSADNSASIPGYRLTGIALLVTNPLPHCSLKGEINNLFDVRYEVFPHYPMPGRTFRLSLQWAS